MEQIFKRTTITKGEYTYDEIYFEAAFSPFLTQLVSPLTHIKEDMKAIRKNQHFTVELELDEVEVRAIIHAFELNARYGNYYPIEGYLRGVELDIYQGLSNLFKKDESL